MGRKLDLSSGNQLGERKTQIGWRRGRDSNPRDPFGPNGFQDRRFQPLTHPSVLNSNLLIGAGLTNGNPLRSCVAVGWPVAAGEEFACRYPAYTFRASFVGASVCAGCVTAARSILDYEYYK
jgi:hypothetical protein